MEETSYKIIVIGDAGVGKSNITSRFCDDRFYDDNVPTLGIDFKYTTCTTLHETTPTSIRLQIWDTAGHDRFATLTAAFYRSCQGVMFCFDLTNRNSFERLDVWYSRLVENTAADKPPPILLVGCKLDLVEVEQPKGSDGSTPQGKHSDDVVSKDLLTSPEPTTRAGSTGLMLKGSTYGFRQVAASEGEAWAREHHALCYIETSAKSNINVAHAFRHLATFVVDSCGGVEAVSKGGGRQQPLRRKVQDESEPPAAARRGVCCS